MSNQYSVTRVPESGDDWDWLQMKPVQQYDMEIIWAVKTLQVKLVYLDEDLMITACMAP